MIPRVSVVIPCYNLGKYIDEAVESVLAQSCQEFEIVIVDDGSTDEETVRILNAYDKPKTTVIRTENQGVSLARNTGIAAALGEYILPLDADDKIAATYVEKAVKVLDASANIGIVTSWVEKFEDEPGSYAMPDYCLPKLDLGGILTLARKLSVASFFRKSDWARTKGYDPELARGMQDTEFWLTLLELGKEAYIIPERMLFYRQRFGGLHHVSRDQYIALFARVIRNHPALYIDNIEAVFSYIMDLTELCNRVGLLPDEAPDPIS